MKLKYCTIRDTRDLLIEKVSRASDKYGDKLLEMMDRAGVGSLQEMNEADIRRYIEDRLRNSCEEREEHI